MKGEHQFDVRHLPEQSPGGSKLHPVDWVVESGAVGDVLREMNCQLRRRQCLRAVTSGVVALLVAGFVWHEMNQSKPAIESTLAPSALIFTAERQVLPDGSIVELRNGAQVVVAFADAVRRVVLTRGEAHFQVTKKAQPFVVAVGEVEVRAVGTAFSVELGDTRVEVMVTEGSVAVENPSRESADAASTTMANPNPSRAIVALVEAGNRVVIPASAPSAANFSPEVVAVESAELDARLAWRTPRLDFSRTPLVEVLSLMNQHAGTGKNVSVVLADPALGRVRVSGVLRADNVDTLLRLLEDEHGIKAEHRTANEVILRKGP